jgi:hypothetical protein
VWGVGKEEDVVLFDAPKFNFLKHYTQHPTPNTLPWLGFIFS